MQRSRSRRVCRTQIFVVDAVHPLAAARRVLQHDVAPLGADDALDGHLVRLEELPSLALSPPDRIQGVEQGTVGAVVGAELQCRQQLRQHPAVVGPVRSTHCCVHAPALRGAKRPRLPHQRLEGLRPNHGEDHLAHHAIGTPRCRLDDSEQDARLATYLARLLDQLVDDAALGFDGDAVRYLDQQLDQAVHDLGLARHAPEGQQRKPDTLGMPAQFPGGFHRCPAPEPFGLVRMHAAQQVRGQRQRPELFKFGDLGQQALQSHAAGIGREPGVGGAVAVVGQQGAQPFAHPSIETGGHALQCRVVVNSLG